MRLTREYLEAVHAVFSSSWFLDLVRLPAPWTLRRGAKLAILPNGHLYRRISRKTTLCARWSRARVSLPPLPTLDTERISSASKAAIFLGILALDCELSLRRFMSSLRPRLFPARRAIPSSQYHGTSSQVQHIGLESSVFHHKPHQSLPVAARMLPDLQLDPDFSRSQC